MNNPSHRYSDIFTEHGLKCFEQAEEHLAASTQLIADLKYAFNLVNIGLIKISDIEVRAKTRENKIDDEYDFFKCTVSKDGHLINVSKTGWYSYWSLGGIDLGTHPRHNIIHARVKIMAPSGPCDVYEYTLES